jgi:hypothetical protein
VDPPYTSAAKDASGNYVAGQWLKAEINRLRQQAVLRPTRQAEILQQSARLDKDWRQFLNADQSRRPATAALIYLCFAVGTVIGMHWKREFKAPRPVQLYPALLPIVPTPRHPSYPSNHSFQSHLIAEMLSAILRQGNTPHGIETPAKAFAARIARNREIGGVHFSADSEAGLWLAQELTKLWIPKFVAPNPSKATELTRLVADIRAEWLHTNAYQTPDQFQPFRPLPDVLAEKVKSLLPPT